MTEKPNILHLRVPSDLKDKLTEKARKNRRSINSEAILAIESYVNEDLKEAENPRNEPPQQSIFDFAGCLADDLTPTQAKKALDELRDQDNND
ncbi:MAG: hypothetical protein RBG13Loki_0600 [Promethearchaeota archaeon CR_4]|nr:MAG: hypothetical protein RBG13Loki_0600 [Candidatus Lokiarchaeota archaeon CR_4]